MTEREYACEELVIVKWIDIQSASSHWQSPEDCKELRPADCATIGWILEENETYITLASDISIQVSQGNEEGYGGVICIPKGCITETVRL